VFPFLPAEIKYSLFPFKIKASQQYGNAVKEKEANEVKV
jgi:hypothetical protein